MEWPPSVAGLECSRSGNVDKTAMHECLNLALDLAVVPAKALAKLTKRNALTALLFVRDHREEECPRVRTENP
jgi:hypothetical protein